MDKIVVCVFNKRRAELMGIAIFLVLLYHLFCASGFHKKLQLLQNGFIGVDFFVILSGYGLCFAYNKYNCRLFYFRRFARILPLFWIQAFIYLVGVCILKYFNVSSFVGKTIDLGTIINIFSTFSFWRGGDGFYNWYVSAICFLYLLFPLFFFLVKKLGVRFYLLVSIFSYAILASFDVEWQLDCLISRIPMFIFGILCYDEIKCNGKVGWMLLISLMFWIVLFTYNVSNFFMVSSVSTVLLFVICNLFNNYVIFNEKVCALLAFLGRHSYEIYISNYFTMTTVKMICNNQIDILRVVVSYIVASSLYGYFFIRLSKGINKIVYKWL